MTIQTTTGQKMTGHHMTGQTMIEQQVIAKLFTDARTHKAFLDRPVDEDTLRRLYDIAKFAPSASNLCPMRIVFATSDAARQKVIDAAAPGNRPKIGSAPVVAIIAHDSKFHQHIGALAPHMDAEAYAAQEVARLEQVAIENSWLQAGVLITAARALGLDCGPMSGFDKAAINDSFFSGSDWRADFLMNIGYGDRDWLHPRGHRLGFDEACRIV
ncbi:MAG: malonic semialdehyde reductase [Candidatus Puniceispirillaceae bacterium]